MEGMAVGERAAAGDLLSLGPFLVLSSRSGDPISRGTRPVYTAFDSRGLWPNAPLLGGVVFSVGLLDPAKTIPGTDWHPWLYLREIAQLGLVGLSLSLGSQRLRRQEPLQLRRHPGGGRAVLRHLYLHAAGVGSPARSRDRAGARCALAHYFWASGSLSSGPRQRPDLRGILRKRPGAHQSGRSGPNHGGRGRAVASAAISLGSVFMGAMTYIGNGPNFMVKAIAEESGVVMPSFFGYIVYSAAILLPLFALVTFVFMR